MTPIDRLDSKTLHTPVAVALQHGFATRVLRSVYWQGSGQLLAQAISWVATLVVIRLLSPADYGLMAMVMLFVNFMLLVADLGVSSALVQAKEVESRHYQQVLGVIIVTNVIAAGVTFLGAPLVAAFFDDPRITLLVRVLSLNFLVCAISSLSQARVIRELDFRVKSVVDVSATVGGAVASLLVAFGGGGVWALVIGLLAQNLVRAVGYLMASPLRIWPVISLQSLSPMLQFGALVSVDRILFFFYGNVDSVLAGKVLGEASLGLYTLALTLAALPLQKVVPTLTQVSFAAFARIQDEPERVRRNLLRAVRLVSAAAFPAVFGMAVVAPVMVPLILGDRWAAVIVPFQVICLILPLRSLSAVISTALLGTGRAGVNLGNMLLSLALMSGAFWVGVQYGVLGLALSWAIMFPIVFLITTWFSLRALAIRGRDLVTSLAPSILFSVVMSLTVLVVDQTLPAGFDGWFRLGILILAGSVVYVGGLYLSDRQLTHDLRVAFSG
ncbi:MAG: lipopolysaccharide biosynthesis protein [Gemmatimonadota bacterium]